MSNAKEQPKRVCIDLQIVFELFRCLPQYEYTNISTHEKSSVLILVYNYYIDQGSC